ncbi:MAG: restriction endonuclease subunit S [Mariniphaga sp.]
MKLDVKALGDCMTLINGRAYLQHELLNSGTPVLRIQNLNGGDNWYYSNLSLPEDKYCKNGDLLFAWSATFGPYLFSGPKSIYHYHIWKIIPKENILDKGFAFYMLVNITQKVKDEAHGISMLHITKSKMEAMQIPLPPLPTQKKIAAILDAADAYRQKTKTLIEKYDQLAQSLFLDMFGDPVRNEKAWEMVKIEKLCTEIVDCVNKTAPSVDFKTEYKMIRTTNVRNYKVCLEEVRYVEKDIFEKWNRRLVPKKGDIVFTREAPMGEAGIICSDEKVFLGQRTMLFRIDDKFSNKYYLLFQLMGKGIEKQIEKLSMGSTVKHLTVPACNEFKLPKPPLSLQTQFAERIQLIEAQKTQAQANLQKAEDLFNSLLQRAFKGELG